MTRMALLALLVLILASCHRDSWHWIQPMPPITIEPDLNPKAYPTFLPTLTPEASLPCARWRVRDCELTLKVGEL